MGETIRPTPELSVLLAVLSYDPLSGELTWLRRPEELFSDSPSPCRAANRWNGRYAGKPALNYTCKTSGYRYGDVFATKFYAHRIAWKMHFGRDPEFFIDHIDGNKRNNAIANLRSVSKIENCQNLRIRADNTSGATGVIFHKSRSKWRAEIVVDQKYYFLGYFTDLEDAIVARKAAQELHGFHENHGMPAIRSLHAKYGAKT